MIFRSLLLVLFSAVAVSAGPLDEAKSLIEDGRFQDAKPLLEKAIRNSANEVEAVLLLTRACNGLEDWKAGVKHGKRAVKLLPNSADAHFEYAVALRIKMSNVGKMKALFALGTYNDELETATRLDPENVGAVSERIGFLINAPGFAGGDLDEAEKELVVLEKLDWLLAKQMQIGIAMKREDTLAALNVSKEILRRHPDHSSSRSTFGFLLQQNNQFEKADAQFAQLVGNEDEEVALGALYQRGRTRILGNYELEEAITLFENYIERIGKGSPRLPSKAAALWRSGMAYEKLGQSNMARSRYKEALKLEPDLKEAKQALKKLK